MREVFVDYENNKMLVFWKWNNLALEKVNFFKRLKFRYDPSTKTWSREVSVVDFEAIKANCPFDLLFKDENGQYKKKEASITTEAKKDEEVFIEKIDDTASIKIPLSLSKRPKKISHYWLFGLNKNCEPKPLKWPIFVETLKNNKEGEAYFNPSFEKDLPEIPLIALMEKKAFKHQKEGIRFLVNRQRAILADDMGLGKTYQAILAAESLYYDGKIQSMVIVCPPTLIGNWRAEINKWDCSVPYKIVPYSMIAKIAKNNQLKLQEKTLVILDEAHYIKNAGSQRTTACFMLFRENPHVKYMWLLTGTPVTKDNSDLFPYAYLLQLPWVKEYSPMTLASMTGPKNLILNGMFAPWMLIRKKEDLLDLPEKITQTIEINTEIEPDYKILESGEAALIMEHLMKIKRLCAEVKAKETVVFAKDILNSGKKVVIFSDHTKVLDILERELSVYGTVRIDGQTPVKDRQSMVDDFQTKSEVRVFLGNIKASGVGITLTASSTVIFNDLTWLPADMAQASCRVHRIGQKGTVNIYYLIDNNLITDVIISNILFRRSEEIATFEGCKNVVMQELKMFLDNRKKGG